MSYCDNYGCSFRDEWGVCRECGSVPRKPTIADLVGPIKDLVSELTELKIECKRLREYIVSRVDNA